VQTLLQWKSNKYWIVAVCVCVCAHVCVCVCARAHGPHCIVIVSRPAVQYFATLSHQLHDFWGEHNY